MFEFHDAAAFARPYRQWRGQDDLKKALSERILNAELDEHIPLDRAGTFDPKLIAKYQRRFPDFDDKIISMYARGMSVVHSNIVGIRSTQSLFRPSSQIGGAALRSFICCVAAYLSDLSGHGAARPRCN